MAIDTIKSVAIFDGSVATADIADDAVTSAKIDSTSTGMTLADLTVDTSTLKVDASNNRVGVGVASPASPFHINLGTDKNLQFSGGIGEIGSVPGFQATNDAGTALTDFGIRANANMRFAIASNERLRVTANGITFNGDTAAANALDDYEEGTFDVTLTTVSGSVTLNSVYNKMSYTKVGRLVTVFGLIITSGVTNPSGAYAHFDTLPFTSANLTEGSGRSGGGVFYWDGSNPHVKPWEISEGSTRLSVYIDASTLTAGDDFYFSCTYQAA